MPAADSLRAGILSPEAGRAAIGQVAVSPEMWQNASGDSWNTASDWSGDAIPTASTDATIGIAGTYTVIIDSAAIAHSLSIDDASATIIDDTALTIGTTLAIDGDFALESGGMLSGGTITLGATGQFSAIDGTLSGVTYDGALGVTAANASITLQHGVALTGASGSGAGTLSVTGAAASVTLEGGLAGAGVIADTGQGATVTIDGARALNNATLSIGNSASLLMTNGTSQSPTVTLGKQFVVADGSGNALFELGGSNSRLVSYGTITASAASTLMVEAGTSFVNAGSIAVTGAASLTIQAGMFINRGSVSVTGSGSTLSLQNFTSTGSILSNGGTVVLGGSFGTASLETVSESNGGIVDIAGILANNGTISIGTGTSLATLALAGTIKGGTIIDAGGGLAPTSGTLTSVTYEGTLLVNTFSTTLVPGTLTLRGNTTLTAAGGSGSGTLSVTGRLNDVAVYGSLQGAGVINDTGQYADITMYGSRTLDNGVFNIGNGYYASLNIASNGGQAATLTLGANYIFNEVGSNGYILLDEAGDELINQGAINAVASGAFALGDGAGAFVNQGAITVGNQGFLTINGSSFTNEGSISITGSRSTLNLTTWTNSGTITNAGGTLSLGGSFDTTDLSNITDSSGIVIIAGTLTNTGTLSVGPSTAFATLSLLGTIEGGVISDSGGLVAVGGTLSGVSYEGALTVQSYVYGNVPGALVLTGDDSFAGQGGSGAGTLNQFGASSTVNIYGSLSGLGVISELGAYAQMTLYDTRTLSDGTFNVGSGSYTDLIVADTTGKGATLTLASDYIMNIVGDNTYFYLSDIKDSLINEGSIEGYAAGPVFIGDGIGSFVNQGLIALSNGDQMTIEVAQFSNSGAIALTHGSTLNLTNLTNIAAHTLTGGSYTVGAGSVLQLGAYSAITTDNADIILAGAGSVIESVSSVTGSYITFDSQLSTIGTAGTLSLLGGRDFRVVAGGRVLTDAGLLNLGGGTFNASSLDISSTGTFAGYGTLVGAVANAGTLLATGGTLDVVSALSGAGLLESAAGAVLELDSGGSLTGTISGAGTLVLQGQNAFDLAGNTISIGAVTVSASSELSGNGSLSGLVRDRGIIAASDGTLTLGGAVNGAGMLQAGSGAMLELAGGGAFGGVVSGDGTVVISSALTLTPGSALEAATIIDQASLRLAGNTELAIAGSTTLTLATQIGQVLGLNGPSSASLTNNGSLTASGGGSAVVRIGFANEGQLTVSNATLTFQASAANDGTISITGGTLVSDTSLTGTGFVDIGTGGTTTLFAGAGAGQSLDFTGVAGLMNLSDPTAFGGTILDFGNSDQIDLVQTTATGLTYDGSVLTVLNGSQVVASLNVTGDYTASNFTLIGDGHGGTSIVYI